MEYVPHLLLFLIVLPGIFSDAFPRGNKEELPDLLQCEQYCHAFQRVCQRAPFTCGGCRHLFMARDGECLPVSEEVAEQQEEKRVNPVAPDSDIDHLAEQRAALNEPALLVEPESNNVVNSALQKKDVDENTSLTPPTSSPPSAPPTAQAMYGVPADSETELQTILLITVIAGCSIAGLIGLVVAGVCWYRLQRNVKAASEAEYPAYGVTGPVPEKVASPGDRKLAQSAQMYHYQHQKQQMIAMEKANGDMTKDGSDADSEEENEEGDYTVYECPGLAPTGEMEVKNPLFSEETPVTPSEHSPPK